MSNEWIEHDGAIVPDLPAGTRVEVRYRDGQNSITDPEIFDNGVVEDWDANWLRQDGEPCGADIIAYRVVSE